MIFQRWPLTFSSPPRSTFHPSDSLVYIFYPIKHEVKSLRLNRKRLGATFGNTFKIIYEIGVAALVFSLYCDYYCDVLNLSESDGEGSARSLGFIVWEP